MQHYKCLCFSSNDFGPPWLTHTQTERHLSAQPAVRKTNYWSTIDVTQ